MQAFHKSDSVTLYRGDCLDVLRELPDNSVDAVVTDPPYGLSNTSPNLVTDAIVRWATGDREFVPDGKGFMGHDWDSFVPPPAVFDECLRVLKPGGHILCFTGSRTIGLMEISIRMAGFDIRESLAWLNSEGFPKGQDLGKAIDKKFGAKRKIVGVHESAARSLGNGVNMSGGKAQDVVHITEDATEEAKQWSGWNSALKPAFEPIIVGRKPFKGTLVDNVLAHGVGGINVNATRIPHRNQADYDESVNKNRHAEFGSPQGGNSIYGDYSMIGDKKDYDGTKGRFPSNVLLDEQQAAVLDEQSGITKSQGGKHSGNKGTRDAVGGYGYDRQEIDRPTDIGGASRFFYVSKASTKERPKVNGVQHSTVKPLSLMEYLVRLVTPVGGTVLDPFGGSGTTVEAAINQGFNVIGVEREAKYLPLIEYRIARANGEDLSRFNVEFEDSGDGVEQPVEVAEPLALQDPNNELSLWDDIA